MTFKECNRNQSLLLPPNYASFLGESHEAVILAEFIDGLNLTSLEKEYGNEHGGASAYHPVMLLTVLIYGYMNGVFSSRNIAKCLHQDLGYMYLAGNNLPDFRTLARFRKEKGTSLVAAFKEVIVRARELGFITFGTVSLDGTKIYANASKNKNEPVDGLEETIRDFIKEAERVDDLEDKMYGDREDQAPPALKTKAGRLKKKQLLAKTRTTNTTDPDARLMKMKRGDFANGYNVQIMTEHGLVLASHVGDSSADQNQLVPTIQTFKHLHGVAPKQLLADKGYSGETNYRFCEQERIDAYIPVHQAPVDMTNYVYDTTRDTYTDVVGRVYRFKQHMKQRGNNTTIYEHAGVATGKKKYLSVAHGWQRYAREQQQKLSSPQGQKIYQQRMVDVEPAFANIKHNLRFKSFRLRGFQGVRNEWNLISLAHNLKKML